MGSTLLLAYNGEDKKKIRMWGYVDTSTNYYMYGDKKMFLEFDELFVRNATFSDSSKVLVRGKYKILILTKNEDHPSISDIYYYYYDVPSMIDNNLSLGQIFKKYYDGHLKVIVTLVLVEANK